MQPPGNDGYLHAVITRGTPVPPWRQLAEILRGQITSCALAPGQQLPSAMQLSERYQVAVPTVRKALNLLKAEGLIVGVAGYGTFVAER